MESLSEIAVGVGVVAVITLVVIVWRRRVPNELAPLPSLGFSPSFYDPEQAPDGAVIISIEDDDKTPVEFVACIIRDYFNFDIEKAFEMMWQVHTNGTLEILAARPDDAERLVARIHEEARNRGYPLKCSLRNK